MSERASHLEKLYIERPSSLEYLWQAFRYGPLSLVFWKELGHLMAYYGINHVKGLHHAHVGRGTRIRPTVLMRDAERIYVGRGCTINHGNILWAGKRDAVIRLGDHVMTGPNVQIYAFHHGMENGATPMVEQPFTEEDVTVGNDVWLGAGSIVLPGVTIGDGVVVAAGSVVTRDLPPHTLCAGIPAGVIRKR